MNVGMYINQDIIEFHILINEIIQVWDNQEFLDTLNIYILDKDEINIIKDKLPNLNY